MALRCRLFGHALSVRHKGRETPLWASTMLLLITGTKGCVLFCRRCDFTENGYAPVEEVPQQKDGEA